MNNNTIKNFSYIGIGRIITVVLQSLLYFVIAALLDPEIYGELALILALAGTFSTVSVFGLNLSVQVYQAKNNTKISDQINTLFLISTSIASLVLLFVNPIAALLCVSLSFFSMSRSNLLGLKKYKKLLVFNIIKSGTFFVIPILLYFVLDIFGIVLGMAISNFIGSIPIFRKIKFRLFFDLKKYYKVLVNNFGLSAGGEFANFVDKLAIAPLFGLFIVGIYQFNFQVFVALGILPGILGAYLVTEESSGVKHKKLSCIVILGSIFLVVIAIFFAPILVPIIFPKYSEDISALQVMIISVIPQAFGAVYRSKLLAKESTKIGISAIVKVGSLLSLLVILGEIYGLIGLSYAVLISVTVNTLFIYFLYLKEKKE